MNHYDLTDFKWSLIEPFQPKNSRGIPGLDGQSAFSCVERST